MSDVEVQFGANISALTDAVKKASGTVSDFGDSLKAQFGGIGGLVEGAAAAFAAGFGADAIKNWIAGEAELGEQLENTAAKLGTTAEQASQLSGIAALTGTDFQSLQTDMERFNLNLGSSGNVTSRAAQGLKALGLNAREFIGVPIPQQLEMLAQAASRFADGGNKTAAMMAILGRSGAEMIPYLDKGREGIEELQQVLARTGATMSDDMAASFAKTDEDIHELGLAWQGLSNILFADLNPAIDSLVRLVTEAAEALTAAGSQAGTVRTALDYLGISARVVASAFTVVFNEAVSTMSLLVLAVEEAVAAIKGLGQVVADAWNHNWSAIASDAKSAWSTMKSDGLQFASDQVAIAKNTASEIAKTLTYNAQADAMSEAMSKLRATMGGAVSAARANFAAIGNASGGAALDVGKLQAAFAGLSKPQAGAMEIGGNKGAEEALEAQVSALNEEIAHFKAVEQQKQALIQEEVKTKTLSAQQGAAATKAALQDELQAAMAAYQQEAALLQGQPEKLQEVLNKEKELQDEYAKEVQKLQIDAAEQSSQAWQKAFETLNSAFDSQIPGLLRGTTTWQKAFQSVFTDLTTKAIEFFLNLGVQAVENEAKQILSNNSIVAAIEAGYAQITAAAGASATAQAAQSIATDAAQISRDAGAVYAGVAAFLAPELGPAALGPAAGDAATVLGIGLSGFEAGAWEVPSDMIAQIHAGEKVIPAGPPAAALDALARGGSTGDVHNHTHNWNVSVNGANDPQSVLEAIEDNVQKIMKTAGRAWSSSRQPRFA